MVQWRHRAEVHPADAPRRAGGHALTLAGKTEVSAVADRFAEWLDGHEVVVSWCRTADPEVRETASLLDRELALRLTSETVEARVRRADGFDEVDGSILPADASDETVGFGPYRIEPAAIMLLLESLRAESSVGAAPLLVGNDPLISWLASELADGPFAIGRGELVCFASDGSSRRWQPAWTIDPHGAESHEAIAAKIESKMNSAKALGAVITALLVFLVQDVLRQRPIWSDWIALVALATSADLYFAALFLYDGLLMPALGVAMLLVATATGDEPRFAPDWRAFGGAAVWLVVVVSWVAANRPRLGVAD